MDRGNTCCRKPDIVLSEDLPYCLSCDTLLLQAFEKIVLRDITATFKREDTFSQSAKSEYVYSPIGDDEFRLLEIQPGAFADELVCHIFRLKIASTRQRMWYDAISYTWAGEDGCQVKDQDIIVSSSKMFGIQTLKATSNCGLALRRVRSMTTAVHVWVDAICINQADRAERGHQVQQMQSIYANANTVYAYVGETADRSDILMDCLSKFQYGQSLSLNTKLWASRGQRNCLDAFLKRRWFSRVWCLQEIGMATKVEVICGNERAPWTNFLLANLGEYCQEQPVSDDRQTTLHYHGTFPLILRLPMRGKQLLTPVRLYRLLEDSRRSCSASDPRDMVYAVLGLLENSYDTGILPDYEMDVGEAYNRTAEYLILRCNTLDFLGQAGHRDLSREQSASLASWAIDWMIRAPRPSFEFDITQTLETSKNLDTPNVINFSTVHGSRRVLMAAGRVQGHVLSARNMWLQQSLAQGASSDVTHNSLPTHPAPSSSTRESLMNAWKSPLDMMYSLPKAPPDRIQDIIDLPQTPWELKYGLLWGRSESGFSEWDEARFAGQVLQQKGATKLTLGTDIDRSFDPWEWRVVLMDIMTTDDKTKVLRQAANEERPMFITDNLAIGIGPQDLEPGDILCKFPAASASHFIRRKDDHYVVLGEAVHFIVDPSRLCSAIMGRLKQRWKFYETVMYLDESDWTKKFCIEDLQEEAVKFYAELDQSGGKQSKSDKASVADQIFELW